MRWPLSAAKEVVTAFLKEANVDDEFFLMTVSSQPEIQTALTDRPEIVETALRSAKARGNTALVDTVYLGLDRLRSAKRSRRALLVVSDGVDNHSRYTLSELMNVAVEADAQIFTVSVNEAIVNKRPVETIADRHGLALMSALAERTGGLNFEAPDLAHAARAAYEAGSALRNQYLIGIQPELNDFGKWHSLKVQVNVPKASVSARNGYRSPP
jgi:Ca-activated chloride channel family protein